MNSVSDAATRITVERGALLRTETGVAKAAQHRLAGALPAVRRRPGAASQGQRKTAATPRHTIARATAVGHRVRRCCFRCCFIRCWSIRHRSVLSRKRFRRAHNRRAVEGLGRLHIRAGAVAPSKGQFPSDGPIPSVLGAGLRGSDVRDVRRTITRCEGVGHELLPAEIESTAGEREEQKRAETGATAGGPEAAKANTRARRHPKCEIVHSCARPLHPGDLWARSPEMDHWVVPSAETNSPPKRCPDCWDPPGSTARDRCT
jgi:hypothetical protein